MKITPTKAEWEGMAYVVVHLPEEQISSLGIGKISPGFKDAYVSLRNRMNSRTCGGIVKSIRIDDSGISEIDPYLLADILAKADDDIDIQPLLPVGAEQVSIATSKKDINHKEMTELCRTYLQRHPLSVGQKKGIYLFTGEKIVIEIKHVIPEDMAVFTVNTRIEFSKEQVASSGGLNEVGGLEAEKKLIRERILLPIIKPEYFSAYGISPPRGVLLCGPPGCGKTMIARALSEEIDANFVEINCSEVFNAFYGESEKVIREKFEKAKAKTPAIILIDEIDAIASSRTETRHNIERRVVTTLLTEMDGLKSGGNVIVIATTNMANTIDSALRRPGRFDYEIHIGIPDRNARRDILGKMTRHMTIARDVDLDKIARRTSGFVGADLMMLCREAAFESLVEKSAEGMAVGILPTGESSKITAEHFDSALKRIKPSGLREFAVELPTRMDWSDLGGLKTIKDTLIQEITHTLKNPESFERVGISPVRGVLLYGPPGTGKTLIARIIANQAEANFISIKGPEVLSKWFGESEERIRTLFSKARESSPCIIFIDEIDAITVARGRALSDAADRVVNQLLTEMDGFEGSKHVCVIAATNRIELIDPALLRPGRFDYQILVPLPDEAGRREIYGIHLRSKPLADDVDLDKLAARSKDFSGAHIFEVCRRAAMAAFRENDYVAEKTKVKMEHLLKALDEVTESINRLEKPKIGFGADRR